MTAHLADEAVRRAEPGDAPAIAELEHEARAALVDARGGAALLSELPAHGDWSPVLADDERLVLVGTYDGVVVGYLELVLPPRGGIGHVRQVYVHPEARELGLGDALLAAAIEAIGAAGGTAVESWALPGDRDTKNLFERAGVTARKLIVSKQVGTTSTAER